MSISNLGYYFKKNLKKNKNRVCLNFGNNMSFSYQQFDELSDKIAFFLKKKGLKENDRISIESKKDLFSFALIMACLKIGVIYNFFEKNEAIKRTNHILEIVKPKIIFLYDENLKIKKRKILVNDNFKKKIFKLSSYNKVKITNKKNLNAYIMFTSGSTGMPKGVLISHKNLSFFIKWIRNTFQINNKSVLTNLNPLHFDNSVFDLYGSFFNGSTLVPFEKNELFNLNEITNKINNTKIDTWFSVPSLLDLFLKVGEKKLFKKIKLKNIIFGGERFPIQSIKKIYPYLKKVRIFNVSGPTECTCMCSAYRVKKKDLNHKDIFVGKINQYFKYKILNENLKEDKIGELYLEGPAVSSGYFNDIKKTKKNFYQTGKFKGYKTGDIVEENKLKLIKIIGRNDNQIKFLGHRIELEEIEKTFIKLFKIKNCIARLKNKKVFPYKKIVIFVDKKFKNLSVVKKKIKLSLPYYMIPEEIKYIKKFIYNSNGKLDRTKY